MSVDQKRGELIKQGFEKSGFKVRNIPLEGDSYRLVIETLKGKEGDSMEIYKMKNSDLIVFSSNIYMPKVHYEKYRHLDDNTRKRFDNKLEQILKSKNAKYEITEDEKGFGIWIHDEIDHNSLTNSTLHQCYENVNNSTVAVYNFLMDYFYGKISV